MKRRILTVPWRRVLGRRRGSSSSANSGEYIRGFKDGADSAVDLPIVGRCIYFIFGLAVGAALALHFCSIH
jgi:hypothetical protein